MHLLPGENLLLEVSPSSRVALVWLFSKGLRVIWYTGATVFFITLVFGSQSPETYQPRDFGNALLFGLSALLLVSALAWLYFLALARTVRYSITDQRFIFHGGIVRRVQHAIEHRRVTDVQLSQNPIEQFLPLHTISLFTPGTASLMLGTRKQPMPELCLEGLLEGEKVLALVSECVRNARGSSL